MSITSTSTSGMTHTTTVCPHGPLSYDVGLQPSTAIITHTKSRHGHLSDREEASRGGH